MHQKYLFTFNNLPTKRGVAMGSLLGPILPEMFMVELENMLVSKLEQHVQKWRRYVDDPFVYV